MDMFVRQSHLEKAIDQIREKYGEDSVLRASFIKGDVDHMSGGIQKEHRNPDKDDIL